jgi:hypothetical protein
MTQILKAATSGANTCDVVFNELYSAYDDYLYPPIETSSSIKAKRFTLNNVGGCKFRVDPGAGAIRDISLNEVTLGSRDSILGSVFKDTQCQLNCRNDAHIASIKQKLAQMDTTANTRTFTKISQSIAYGPTECEYMMTKNITTQDPITKRFSTETDLDTFVKASFTLDSSTCTFSLQEVKEYDPESITSDTRSGEQIYYVNGVATELPYLYNYDNTIPGSRVDQTVKILS